MALDMVHHAETASRMDPRTTVATVRPTSHLGITITRTDLAMTIATTLGTGTTLRTAHPTVVVMTITMDRLVMTMIYPAQATETVPLTAPVTMIHTGPAATTALRMAPATMIRPDLVSRMTRILRMDQAITTRTGLVAVITTTIPMALKIRIRIV